MKDKGHRMKDLLHSSAEVSESTLFSLLSFILNPLSSKVLCKSSHFVWNSKINRIIRTIFRTNKTVFLPPPFFSRGSERGSVRCTPPSGVRRRPVYAGVPVCFFKEVRSPGRTIACPGTQASPPASSPLKPIKRFIKKESFNGSLYGL